MTDPISTTPPAGVTPDAWARHLAGLDRGMEQARCGQTKDARRAIRDIADRLGLDLDEG